MGRIRRKKKQDMEINGILIDPADHVVTLSAAVKAGETVSYLKDGKICTQAAAEEIPRYHKMAVVQMKEGQHIRKYGSVIGEATQKIAVGSWVHRHNLQSVSIESEDVEATAEPKTGNAFREDISMGICAQEDRDVGTKNIPKRQSCTSVMMRGYLRPDGKVGIRNHVLILPCSLCASETARFAAQNVRGAVYVANQGGCSLSRRDLRVTLETLSGLAANPNVYGTILVGNGCEVVQASLLADKIREKTCKPLEVLVIREEGGSIKTALKIAELAEKMRVEADDVPVTEVSVSELILGTECGGSDPTSGLAANPVVGACSNLLVEHGGTVILSETPELIGTEEILAKRCKDEKVKERLLSIIKDYEQDFILVGENPRSGNPTPGNIAGGITTLEEKSLGCIHKAGGCVIQEVVEYGAPVTRKGLVVMDTPGQDIASIVGMAAAGAQMVVFTTGHGTPTGSGIVPVIKLTANQETAALMEDNIDFDCSGVLIKGKALEEAGRELFELVERVACGQETTAEVLGFQDVSMARYCNFA